MRPPTAAQLLDTWDQLRDATMARRAAVLAGLAAPDLTVDALAALPLGRRDRLLIDLRTCLFGSDVEGLVRCPRCAETIEAPFSLRDLAVSAARDDREPVGRCELDLWDVRFRAPTCGDAVALGLLGQVDARTLIGRCVLDASEDGVPVSLERVQADLPDVVVSEIARGITAIDPGADLLLDVECPSCRHRWSSPFDAPAFLWTEMTAWARRTIRDVAALASAYGWRESDILAMSPRRRADYLDLLSA